jgi:hypothetical protein
VLDKVAETDKRCIRPALVALMKPDCPCANEAISPKDPRFAQYCANKLAEQIKTIAAAGVGCSPFQVGVGSERPAPSVYDMWPTHIATLLSQRALAADDTASALHEILDAVRVSQDATRGRVPLSNAVITATMEGKLLATALELVTKQPMSDDQLVALTAKVDALIETEPAFIESFRGEVVYMALHLGVVAIKGPLWVPPGGRSDIFPPHFYPVDYQEDVGATFISAELQTEERLVRSCTDDNLAACFFAVTAAPIHEDVDIAADVQRAGTLLALAPSEGMRVRLRREVIARNSDSISIYGVPLRQRAHIMTRFAALRMQLDALRAHACPALEANAVETYYVRGRPAPGNLGGALQLRPVDGGIDVLPPVWLKVQKPVTHISCP